MRIIAESARRKCDLLEDWNAFAVFYRPEAASLLETAQCFSLIHETTFLQALKRATVIKADITALGMESTDETTYLSRPSSARHFHFIQCKNTPLMTASVYPDGAGILAEEA